MRFSRSQHIISLALAIFIFAVWWTFHRGRDVPPEPTPGKPLWFVEAAGDVRRPGVYPFESPPTAAQVFAAAGGLLQRKAKMPADEAAAEPLTSGTLLNVRSDGKGPTHITRSVMDAAKRVALSIPLDLNVATARELEVLPFVGPDEANGIVTLRRAKGRFSSPDELLAVKGIGSKTLNKIRPFVTIGSP